MDQNQNPQGYNMGNIPQDPFPEPPFGKQPFPDPVFPQDPFPEPPFGKQPFPDPMVSEPPYGQQSSYPGQPGGQQYSPYPVQPVNPGKPGKAPKPPKEKGSNTALIIILVVLLCALVAVGSILIYKLVSDKKDDSPKSTTEEGASTETGTVFGGINTESSTESSTTSSGQGSHVDYSVEEGALSVDITTDDEGNLKTVKLKGLGDINKEFPAHNYSLGTCYYFFSFYINGLSIFIQSPDTRTDQETIRVQDMECNAFYSYYDNPAKDDLTINDIKFDVEYDAITIYDIPVPDDKDLSLENGRASIFFSAVLGEDNFLDYTFDIPYTLNGVDRDTLKEQKTESTTTESTTEATTQATTQSQSGGGGIRGHYMGTDPNLEGAQPEITFYSDGSLSLKLNFSEGMNTYTGIYTTSTRENESDDLYVYITLDYPSNGIASTCTVMFNDSMDYCYFMDDGFGLMGYSDPPYYMELVD